MDRLALGAQNSSQLQGLGHIQAGEQAVTVQEMAMPGMIMVTAQSMPVAGEAPQNIQALEQDVLLTAMALDKSPFAAPAPTGGSSSFVQIAPRVERGRGPRAGYSYNVMNAYTLLNIQHGQVPQLTQGQQGRLGGLRPRSRVEHLRMEQRLKTLMRRLVGARLHVGPAPVGAVTNRLVIGEQAYRLQEMTGAMPMGLSETKRAQVWNETNYGYRPSGPVGPNHYDTLERAAMNAELNRMQGTAPRYQMGAVPEAMRPEPSMTEKKPEPELVQEEPKPTKLEQSMALKLGRSSVLALVL
jgi:hypothetical protein